MVMNKRHHYRIPVHINTQLRDHNGIPSAGLIVNMTTEGCAVRQNYPPRTAGLIYTMSFNVPGRTIECRAQVKSFFHQNEFGLQFLGLSEVDRVYIAAYLYQRMQSMGFRPL